MCLLKKKNKMNNLHNRTIRCVLYNIVTIQYREYLTDLFLYINYIISYSILIFRKKYTTKYSFTS